MRLWKVLNADRTNSVAEVSFAYPPDGEWTKHVPHKTLELCARGYHFCEGAQVLDWLREGLLAEVESCPRHESLRGDNKCVSCKLRGVRTFRLDAKTLRLFACDCAERALLRERKRGREPDKRLWDAIRVARLFAVGKATEKQLVAAYAAATAAATTTTATADAAAAATADAADAAAATVVAAATAAARTAERDWQYRHLLNLVEAGEP